VFSNNVYMGSGGTKHCTIQTTVRPMVYVRHVNDDQYLAKYLTA